MNFCKENLSDDELEALQSYCQDVFIRNPRGLPILTYWLYRLDFFKQAQTEEERIKQNFAKEILFTCGIWNADNLEEIVVALSQINPKLGVNKDAG